MRTLGDCIEDLISARNYVQSGNYIPAQTCYDGFIASLNRYLNTLGPSAEKERWQEIKQQIKQEVASVMTLANSLNDLQRKPIKKAIPPASSVPCFDEQEDRFGPPSKPRGSLAAQQRPQLPRRQSNMGVQNTPAVRKGRNQPASQVQINKTPAPRGAPTYAQAQNPVPTSSAPNNASNVPVPRDITPSACQYEGISPDVAAAVHDCIVESTGVTFDQIAGLKEAKRLLEEAVVLPMLLPDFFTGVRSPWRGVLLFGPPGTGKTLLAKAIAMQAGFTFFSASASVIESKYRGEAEKMVRGLFTIARARAPSCIFIDEIDAIMSARGSGEDNECSRRIKAEILTQMQGVTTANGVGNGANGDSTEQEPKPVMTLAATNLPWDLDEALKRRLEKRIYIPLPDFESRKQLLKLNLKDITTVELDFDDLANRLEGFSGADISILVREVSMAPLRREISGKSIEEIKQMNSDPKFKEKLVVLLSDFEDAIKKTRPSVDQSAIKKYEKWFKEFGNI
ncbi:Katanin [Giardia lamblia P15]|uniref:Katanin p60 ATPase-containing subunit A1 n=1 Tax=Giardia intestinalis (strain P15) TaxID=658858 RepID=E1F711_GIAIA|nr:Katanin [Giardia lamblia P15]